MDADEGKKCKRKHDSPWWVETLPRRRCLLVIERERFISLPGEGYWSGHDP